MKSFPQDFRALVIGASGAIGAAFVARLQANPKCAAVVGLHRQSLPLIDFEREETIAAAAEALSREAPFDLIINAAGLLHSHRFMPEKRFSDLNYARDLSGKCVRAGIDIQAFLEINWRRSSRDCVSLGEGGKHRRQPLGGLV